jgi:hypothetical protein
MKKFFFDSVAFLGKAIINFFKGTGELLACGIESVFGFFSWTSAQIFRFVLWLIDKERIDHAEQVLDQFIMSRELEILGAITHVKESALSSKVWSENHSKALNILGNRLFQECDWEEDRIHDYMRRVVESIPGLGYAVGGDDDDDDEDDGIVISD